MIVRPVKSRQSQGERARSSARRRRDTERRRPITHIALPGYELARDVPRPRETVAAFLRRTGWARRHTTYGWQFRNGLPTILEVNGEPVLRKRWRSYRIAANDNLRFVSRPMGGKGGTKQILGLVALVAVSAFALWAGPALAAGLGLSGTMATVVGGLTTAAVTIGGSLAISALTAPKAGGTNVPDATIDQIYTAQAQGNIAKLGQPLPVGYGREKVFPDFAATPWAEFVGNDQFQNILLSVGMGKYSYEQLYVDDTPFWDPDTGIAPAFSSAKVAFYEPGEDITLFAVNVAQAAEVTGQQLPDPATTPRLGPYVANGAGTKAMALAIDFVFPGGCFTINSEDGSLQSSSVGLVAEYAPVNDAGAVIGEFKTLFNVERTYATRSPIRDSIKVNIDLAEGGRYTVRFGRTNPPLSGTDGSNDVVWAGLRAFLAGSNSFADVSTIAIQIKGTESTQGSFRFGAVRTRIVKVWDTASNTFVEQPSRNPGWAGYDMVTNTQYGPAFNRIDFNTWLAFAQGCDARGDKFDYTFTTAMAFPEALDKALTVARARHFWLGDTVSVVRDEWRDVPTMMLTDREVVRDSVKISLSQLGEDDADAAVLEYIDEDIWKPASVQYPPDTFEWQATNPAPIRIDGVVNRDHGFREAAFWYLQALLRREKVTIGTEYEGRAITCGSAIRLQSDLPMTYGQAGAVVERADNILTLNPVPVWVDDVQHFVRLRRPNGKFFGPVDVTQGEDASVAVLDPDDLAAVESQQGITLAQVLARASGGEPPTFELGTADNQSKLCVVKTGRPNGNQCSLELYVDDERVHATDLGSPPVLPTPQFPTDQSAPVVSYLTATFGQVIAEPTLTASWWPSAGAQRYSADVSYDAGASWIGVYEAGDTQFTVKVDRAALRLRVQAIGARRGPYSFVDLQAPVIQIAPGTVNNDSLVKSLQYQVDQLQKQVIDKQTEMEEFITNTVSNLLARVPIDKRDVRRDLTSVSGRLSASISEVMTVATDTNTAFAEYQLNVATQFDDQSALISQNATAISGVDGNLAQFKTTVNASFGVQSALITQNSTAISDANGKLSAIVSLQLDVNGHVTGWKAVNNGTTGTFIITTDFFKLMTPAGVELIVAGVVNGSSASVINGVLFGDNTISVKSLIATTLSAISVNAGEISAGKVRSTDSKTVFDLNAGTLIVSDNA